jgi:LysM repeat protein
MGKCFRFWVLGAAAIAPFAGRAQSAADFTNLREDISGLTQRVAELTLRVEQLENSSGTLRASKPAPDAVTSAQLQAAVADLSAQMERLRATMPASAAAAAGSARSENALHPAESAPKAPVFSEDFPKQGIPYTVQKGDTLALIAKKTGGKSQDIINANKLADPSKIQIGRKLFIPGGK